MDGNAVFNEDALSKFFGNFRQRLSVLDRLYLDPGAERECHVLLAASLDALASHWWCTFNSEKIHHGPRMQAFIRVCGRTDILDRCCRSELLQFADRHRAKHPGLPDAIRTILRTEDKANNFGTKSWRLDPLLVQVQQRLSRSPINLSPEETVELKKTRYGHAIYSEHRYIWIHELQPCVRSADGRQQPGFDEPWFQHTVRTDNNGNLLPGIDRQIVPPWSFLRETLEECINGFELQCKFSVVLPKAVRD
jgi:hypothetical protein